MTDRGDSVKIAPLTFVIMLLGAMFMGALMPYVVPASAETPWELGHEG